MGNLIRRNSNKKNYAYTEDEVKQVFAAIEYELKIAKAKFAESEATERKFQIK